MRFSKELIPIVIVLAALVAFNIFYKRNEPSGVYAPRNMGYTSYSAEMNGAKALYLLLDRLGYEPKRLRTPYHGMDEGLAMVIAPRYPISESEADRLMEWVRKGNTLLFVPHISEMGLIDDLGIRLRQRRLRPKNVKPFAPTDLTAGIQNLAIESGNRIRTGRTDAIRHFRDRAGVVVISLSEGEGTVVVLSDPYIITNKGLAEGGNLDLMVNILLSYTGGEKTIYFDEYHHGFETRQSILSLLRGTALGWALVQVAIAIILLMYSRGRRFGQPKPAIKEIHRSSLEYVTSLANIYQNAQASDIALSNLHERLLQSIRTPASSEEIKELIEECERKMNQNISEGELLDLSRRIALAQHPEEEK